MTPEEHKQLQTRVAELEERNEIIGELVAERDGANAAVDELREQLVAARKETQDQKTMMLAANNRLRELCDQLETLAKIPK